MLTTTAVPDFDTFKHLFSPENAVDFVQNDHLQTVFDADTRLQPFADAWRGTPLDADGRFMNLGAPMVHDFRKFLKWQFGTKPQKAEKRADKWRHSVLQTALQDTDFLNTKRDILVWLGHATYFLRINGITLLIDPVFGGMPFVPRLAALPFSPDVLPALDYILVSHNHRDHADAASMRRLLAAPKNRRTKILTGLGMPPLLKSWTCGQPIQAAGWWQGFDMAETGLRITFTPTQHWARRGLTDMNEMLWGGFMIENIATQKTVYFAGDSGYGSLFGLIGAVFPNIDVAMIGCGAYKPDFIMKSNHTSPDEAVQVAIDCGAKTLLPMHYGTFDLSDEPLGEPSRRLTELQATTTKTNIEMLKIGEIRAL